eukprot:CAMPEP_0185569660 /NCGR_PEP_ID=MMETSP0434-20130131/2211_1 /TAXON_ID=626734 ORGANISM="Favella taraikaensis, Strain Fe Narragansett Bay" /NCGR_SAMPLE_ID=MMETSP0434 /ASSEMBLY_ACC=CAM_ASM_000379 /LENGTH=65 /DNA_ID=CAMNT_0028184509 /DNA_START=901 /DNA_END=1098 /DNA_ORIENTATION=-
MEALDSRIEPNYLSTYEFFLASKKRKNLDIQEKQAKKGYLMGYPQGQRQADDQSNQQQDTQQDDQ